MREYVICLSILSILNSALYTFASVNILDNCRFAKYSITKPIQSTNKKKRDKYCRIINFYWEIIPLATKRLPS